MLFRSDAAVRVESYLDVDEVVATLVERPGAQHVVITGRDAPQALIDALEDR